MCQLLDSVLYIMHVHVCVHVPFSRIHVVNIHVYMLLEMVTCTCACSMHQLYVFTVHTFTLLPPSCAISG